MPKPDLPAASGTPDRQPAGIHLLLVEDDPISAAFLADALSPLVDSVTHASNGRQALAAVADQNFDAWLIDLNLPDASGIELLAGLRECAERARTDAGSAGQSIRPPALALTADPTDATRSRALAAGFRAVVGKPIGAAALRAWVHDSLADRERPAATAPAPDWDDRQALAAAGGSSDIVARLRALFLHDLPRHRSEIADALASNDHDRLRAELHRIKSACGFVGATRILAAARRLADHPSDRDAQAGFDSACLALLNGDDYRLDRSERVRG